jgi:hypothetical protein
VIDSSSRRIIALAAPRRVWSARTPTQLNAASGTLDPPGTAIRDPND